MENLSHSAVLKDFHFSFLNISLTHLLVPKYSFSQISGVLFDSFLTFFFSPLIAALRLLTLPFCLNLLVIWPAEKARGSTDFIAQLCKSTLFHTRTAVSFLAFAQWNTENFDVGDRYKTKLPGATSLPVLTGGSGFTQTHCSLHWYLHCS